MRTGSDSIARKWAIKAKMLSTPKTMPLNHWNKGDGVGVITHTKPTYTA